MNQTHEFHISREGGGKRETVTERQTDRESDRPSDTQRIIIQPMYIIQLFINSYPDEIGNSYADFVKPAK